MNLFILIYIILIFYTNLYAAIIVIYKHRVNLSEMGGCKSSIVTQLLKLYS